MDGLSQGTNYDLVVEALAGGDVAAASAPVAFSTPTIPAVPNLSVDQKNLTSARANWNQLNEGGVTHYRVVVYRAGTTSIASEKTVDVGSGSRSTTMTGLAQGNNYEMYVQALKNGVVLSNSGRVAFATLQPAAPVITSVSQSGSTIRFNWTHFVPSGTSGNVVYRIERRGSDGLWKTVKAGISASEGTSSQTFQISRTASANPLDQNKTYDFRIVAVYSSLEVISSNILSFKVT